MIRQNISSGTIYETMAGYSRAVRLGNVVHVSGTTATDGASEVVGIGDSGAQTEFIIQKIERALQQAGAELSDVVRTRIYLAPGADWEAVTSFTANISAKSDLQIPCYTYTPWLVMNTWWKWKPKPSLTIPHHEVQPALQ